MKILLFASLFLGLGLGMIFETYLYEKSYYTCELELSTSKFNPTTWFSDEIIVFNPGVPFLKTVYSNELIGFDGTMRIKLRRNFQK